MGERRTTIRLPEDLHRRAKAKAALQDTTITSVVKACLERWLAEESPEQETEDEKVEH